MTSLVKELSAIVGAAFAHGGLPPALGRVTPSDRPDLADYQCTGAMAAAKERGENPRALATAIVGLLRDDAAFAEVTLAGPGFINLRLADAFLVRHADEMAGDARLKVKPRLPPRRVVIDFGGPNVAKPMHVGHLRSTIIGDCLQRLLRFLGEEVVSDVHLGDWGLQMGQVITEVARRRPDLPYFAPGAKGPFPSASPVTLEDLEALYPAASAACKADPARNAEAQAATVALQNGHPGYGALWRHFVAVSLVAMRREFEALDVHFDLYKGESDAQPLIAPMLAELGARGLLEESEGALILRVAREGDRSELPPLILRSSQGAALYHTTDLATVIDRVRTIDPDLILYVVDQRQSVHLEQLFRAAERSGIAGRARLEHVGFGTVNGTDGRPFKTREGGVMKLADLIGEARAAALRRLDEAGLGREEGEEERGRIAAAVALAAIKFADLSNYRLSSYVFDLDRFMRFEGKTGPYLLYAAVRIKSILRRAEGMEEAPIRIEGEVVRSLMLRVLGLEDALLAAEERRSPAMLCDYAFELAQAFSRFYGEHHVTQEADAALRGSRLRLSRVTLAALLLVLSLLGIRVPERM